MSIKKPYIARSLQILAAVSLIVGAITFVAPVASAQEAGTATETDRMIGSSGFLVPRFVSLGVSKANMRVGPKQTHPIAWVYQKKGLPLEIVQEHESWRKVRDIDGAIGWMHKRLLVGKRTAIVTADWAEIRDLPDALSVMVIRAERGVYATVDECQINWCLVSVDGDEGWVPKSSLWGVYADEVFD
ncbi:MAG: aspartyl-trna synthetase [Alphaproteobacteria bacterium]|nr:MAG: aspartyl-trna synthetase [Alphaproteobacteria bacterium]